MEAIDEQQQERKQQQEGEEGRAGLGGHRRRQTLLLSATLTTGIEQLSEVSMRHPMFIDVAEDDEGTAAEDKDKEHRLTTPESLKQTFCLVPAKLKLVTLTAFIVWKCRLSRRKSESCQFFTSLSQASFIPN